MPKSPSKSTASRNSSKVRTINRTFPTDRLCRYLLAGNRRCQRTQTNTGSGLCILHDRHLSQLRDAQSETLGNEALGRVTDFNSAISIHAVLSRVVMLGLHRRYSTKEVSVFTYAMQSLRQTLGEAAHEIHNYSGLNARNNYIGRAIGNEPSLSKPATADSPENPTENAEAEDSVGEENGFVGTSAAAPTANVGEIPPPPEIPTQAVGASLGPATRGQDSPTQTLSEIPTDPKIINPAEISGVQHSGDISRQSQKSADTPEDARALESIRSGLSRIKNHFVSAKQSLVPTMKTAVDAGVF